MVIELIPYKLDLHEISTPYKAAIVPWVYNMDPTIDWYSTWAAARTIPTRIPGNTRYYRHHITMNTLVIPRDMYTTGYWMS